MSLPNGGTGWSGVWLYSENPSRHVFGDSFDSYPNGAAGTMSADEQFTSTGQVIAGFSGSWLKSASGLSISTYSGLDKQLTLENAQLARVLNIGTSWNSIRIIFRYRFTDVPTFSGKRWYCGVMSNPAGTPLSNGPLNGASMTHGIGAISTNGTWTRSSTYYSLGTFGFKRVGSTLTALGAGATDREPFGAHSMNLVEITKGSPNYTIRWSSNGGSGTYNFTFAQMLNSLQSATITGRTINSQTVAVDEGTDGVLNALVFAWEGAPPTYPSMSLLDILFMRRS